MTISRIENIIFSARRAIIAVFAVITLLMIWQVSGIKADTSLEKMVPLSHPYIQNLFKHKDELGLGNDIRIAVAVKQGDIFSPAYVDMLKSMTDDIFYLSDMPNREAGAQHAIVDRAKLKSLWTPNVRWSEVTKDGFQGGEVTQGYDGSPAGIEFLRSNILRSGQVGRLVADDFKSTIIQIPLLDGEKIDYKQLSANLEVLRDKYQAQNQNVEIHIIGFAKKVGDLIDGPEGCRRRSGHLPSWQSRYVFQHFDFAPDTCHAGLQDLTGKLLVIYFFTIQKRNLDDGGFEIIRNQAPSCPERRILLRRNSMPAGLHNPG